MRRRSLWIPRSRLPGPASPAPSWCATRGESGAGRAVGPDNLDLVEIQVESRLARGDVPGARTAIRAALGQVDFAKLARSLGSNLWVDDSLLALALQLPPAAFAEDRPEGLLALASVQMVAGRYADARANADSARPLLQGAGCPPTADPRVPALLMIAYAWTGRRPQALAQSERWRALIDPHPNTAAWTGLVGQRALIDMLTGDTAAAIVGLDSLLHLPGALTPAVLRVDPMFASLRGNPRFERLLKASR